MISENIIAYEKSLDAEPMVSIVMANYNGGLYLRECVNSVLEQSYRNFEFIIIDDCSTSDDYTYLSSLDDSRIRLHRNTINEGQTKSLNTGLQLARGKYIARMDSDDVCLPHRLSEQVDFLEKNSEIVLLGSQAIIIDEYGDQTGEIVCATTPDNIWAYSFFANPFIHSSIMFRSELITEHKFRYDESYINQDFELWSRILPRFQTSNLSSHLIKYRVHSNNMTSRHFDENLHNTAKIIVNRAKYENFKCFNQEQVLRIVKYVFDSRDKANADRVDLSELGLQLWRMAREVARNKRSLHEFYRLIILRLFQSSLPPQKFGGIYSRLHLLIKMSMLQPSIVFQVFFKLCSKKLARTSSTKTKSRYV